MEGLYKFKEAIGTVLDKAPKGLPNFGQLQNVVTELNDEYDLYKDQKGRSLKGPALAKVLFQGSDRLKTMCRHIKNIAESKRGLKIRRGTEAEWLRELVIKIKSKKVTRMLEKEEAAGRRQKTVSPSPPPPPSKVSKGKVDTGKVGTGAKVKVSRGKVDTGNVDTGTVGTDKVDFDGSELVHCILSTGL